MSRRAATITGWAIVGLTAALSVPSLLIAATNPPPAIAVSGELESEMSLSFSLFGAALSMVFSVVGAVIVSKRPDNGLGWVFAAGGAITALDELVTSYGYRALAADPGSLPAGRAAAWLGDTVELTGFGLLTVFLFLLFPEGRLRDRAARRIALVAIVGIGLGTLGAIVEPTLAGYRDVATPLELGTPSAVFGIVYGLGYLAVLGALVASLALLFVRLRRAVGRERDQLRLLVWAAAIAMALLAPVLVLPPSITEGIASLMFAVAAVGLLLVPVSVGVAILRHGLLDIDLVIRRTVVIALLGAFITSIYVGVVVGVGAFVGSTGNAVLSAIAAAVVALAFQPVRRRAQRLANRLVFGKRATPYEVLHEFSERVAGSYGTEDVLPRMAAILGEGTGAERAQVWLRIGTELRPAAASPGGVRRSSPVSAHSDELPPIPDVSHAVPVRDRGELLGALSITKSASDPVTPTEERLVGDLALQAGLVLRNVRLVEDLRASRGRLVAAQDEERRKLERNIHDGAQQQLVALTVKARLAEGTMDKDPGRARGLMAEIRDELQEALDDMRDLARGIYPPLLADRGLVTALEAQARKSPVPALVEADGVDRYRQEMEAAVYFCCLEALQNAAKYADASRAVVRLAYLEGELAFEVEDDGQGFDPSTTPRGHGLQNMTDRLDALGGTLEIRSEPGRGATVAGRLPVERAR